VNAYVTKLQGKRHPESQQLVL